MSNENILVFGLVGCCLLVLVSEYIHLWLSIQATKASIKELAYKMDKNKLDFLYSSLAVDVLEGNAHQITFVKTSECAVITFADGSTFTRTNDEYNFAKGEKYE